MSGDNDTQSWCRCFSNINISYPPPPALVLYYLPHQKLFCLQSDLRSSIQLSLINLYTLDCVIDIDLHILVPVFRHHQHIMSFLFHGNAAKSTATYLFQGLFPNLSRYLSGEPRYVSNLGVINFRAHAESCSKTAKPSTAFMCAEQSSHIVAQHTCYSQQPVPKQEGVVSSLESSLAGISFNTSAQAASNPPDFPENEAGPSAATGKLNESIQSRPDLSTGFRGRTPSFLTWT